MERRVNRGEAALEQLLERIDDAVDTYNRARRLSPDRDPRRLPDGIISATASLHPQDEYWDAWWALPIDVRDWLLWTAPGWWALPPGAFRRLLLSTARLIVARNMPARVALRRAAAQLRLPSPRPLARTGRASARPTNRQSRLAGRRGRRSARMGVEPQPRPYRVAARRVRRGPSIPRPGPTLMRRGGARRMGRMR